MNSVPRSPQISVVGGSRASNDMLKVAERVGERIANRNAVLVCGGLGGVMKAACRGAKNAGGTTVGILPTRNAGDANHFVDVPIVTGMGDARNVTVALSGNGVVAIDGRFGTTSEIALALNAEKPVAGLQAPVLDEFDDTPHAYPASSAEEAVEWVFNQIQ